MDAEVLVVGAINQDIVIGVSRHPQPGETLMATRTSQGPGGKGANQAAAAARVGARVALASAVGDDEIGREQKRALERDGVDISLVRNVVGVPTGTAHILVDESGENTIVVAQGANAYAMSSLETSSHRAKVVLVQNEVPFGALSDAARFARKCGARLIVNVAPVPEAPLDFYPQADPLVVNEHEALLLAESDNTDPQSLARELMARIGMRSVVITLGARGCLLAEGDAIRSIPAVRVDEVVDTTGAGDVFVGVLAARLSAGDGLIEAAERAVASAADAVTWAGARPEQAT
ncbi:ribokinase [Actinomyces sp. B33]|uniref:ribokinase n=1 Tax=Actinomyces sp. B33 TaxID=2942131 RepID=UPI002372A431|nr:ribokinase [Actinomyces sp. B33]